MDGGSMFMSDSDEIDVLKRKYRYGKRSAMPYRFGRKRSWQSIDGSENNVYVKLTPEDFLKYKLSKDDNIEDDEEVLRRAMYRYGRK